MEAQSKMGSIYKLYRCLELSRNEVLHLGQSLASAGITVVPKETMTYFPWITFILCRWLCLLRTYMADCLVPFFSSVVYGYESAMSTPWDQIWLFLWWKWKWKTEYLKSVWFDSETQSLQVSPSPCWVTWMWNVLTGSCIFPQLDTRCFWWFWNLRDGT